VLDVLQAVATSLAADTGRPCLDIVDAGGGTGGFAVPLAGLGHSVTVIDPSPDSLAAAQRRSRRRTYRCAPSRARRPTWPAGQEQSADLVLCHSVLEYVDSPPAAMAAIAAVLRPGGAVSVLTASAVAAVIHRALAGRFDEARRLLTGIGPRRTAAATVPRRTGAGRRAPGRRRAGAGRPAPARGGSPWPASPA
jgi:2-polyprenyl-3-methyl-5-hydroxy-6-metoxy-1,4-benzoquinol methylase